MAAPLDPLDPNTPNPFVTDAMRKRSQPVDTTYIRSDAPDGSFENTTDGLTRRLRSSGENFASYVPALQGLGNQLMGDQEGAQKRYQEYNAMQERAQAIGPDVQTLDDVERRGNTVGAYAEFAATQAANFLPDIVATVATGGVGGAVGAGVARRAGLAAVEGVAKRQAAKATITNLAEDVVKAQGKGAAERVARAELRDATSQRTARMVAPGLDGLAETGTKVGQIGGATVGQYPGVVADSVQALQETDQEGALKIAGVDVISAAFGSLPAERFLSRIGSGAAKDAITTSAREILPRVAKEFGKQGALEGGIGVGQAAIQLAGHKWVNENVDLLGPEAFDRYLAEFVGGGLAGGSLSGAHTAGVSTRDLWQAGAEGRGEKYNALKERLAKHIDTASKASRAKLDEVSAKLREKSKAGQPIDSDVEGDAGAPSAFADLYNTVKGKASDLAGKAKDAAGKVKDQASSLADRFKANEDKIVSDEDIDVGSGDAARAAIQSWITKFESGETDAPLEGMTGDRAPSTNPIALDNGLQNVLATVFPKDDAVWQQPDAVRSVMRSVEKIFTGDQRTKSDDRNIAKMFEWFPEQIAAWEAVGPDYAEAINLAQSDTRKVGKSEAEGRADDARIQNEDLATGVREQAVQEGRDSIGAVDVNTTNADVQSGLEAEQQRGYGGITEGDANVAGVLRKKSEAVDELANMSTNDPKYRERQTEARDWLLGTNPDSQYAGGDAQRVFKEGTNQTLYQKKLNSPSTILMDETFFAKGKKRTKLLELGNTIQLMRQREPGLSMRAAVERMLGDFQLAGIGLDLRTLQPGEVKTVNGKAVGQLTPNDVALLRGTTTTKDGKVVSTAQKSGPVVARTPRQRRLDKKTRSKATKAAHSQHKTIRQLANEKATLGESREYTKVDEETGTTTRVRDERPDQREASDPEQQYIASKLQAPRKPPPTERVLSRTEARAPNAALPPRLAAQVTRIDARRAKVEAAHTKRMARAKTKADKDRLEVRRQQQRNEIEEDKARVGRRIGRALESKADLSDPSVARAIYAQAERGELRAKSPVVPEADGRAAGTRDESNVSTTAVVSDVSINTPNEATVTRAYKAQRDARKELDKLEAEKAELEQRQNELDDGDAPRKGDSEIGVKLASIEAAIPLTEKALVRAQTDAGRQIGLAELAKLEAETTPNRREVGKKRRLLEDKNSEDGDALALDYFNKSGDAFSVSVLETAQDSDAVTGREGVAVAKAEEPIKNVFRDKNMKDVVERLDEIMFAPSAGLKNMLGPRRADRKTPQTYAEAFNSLSADDKKNFKLLLAVKRALDELPEYHPVRKYMESITPEWQQRIDNVDPAFIGPDNKTPSGKAKIGADSVTQGPKAQSKKAGKPAVDAGKARNPAPNLLDPKRSTKDKAELKAIEPAPVGQAENRAAREEARAKKDRIQFDEDIDAGVKSATGDGAHDYTAETDMANALIGRMGLKDKVTVKELPLEHQIGPGEKGGAYFGAKGVIYVNPGLKGRERIEVIAHEIGHHVLRAEIARAMGGGVTAKDLGNFTEKALWATLEEHNPTLHAALSKDFDAWMAANPLSTRVSVARASRAPQTRAKAILSRNTRSKMTIADLSTESVDGRPSKRNYMYSMDEWMADNIARALTTKKEAVTVVEKFFQKIADQFRAIYEAMFSDNNTKWAPAPSVEKWVQGLFDANTRDVYEAFGHTAPVKSAEATIKVAAEVSAQEAARALNIDFFERKAGKGRATHKIDKDGNRVPMSPDTNFTLGETTPPPPRTPRERTAAAGNEGPPSNIVPAGPSPTGKPSHNSPRTVEAMMRFVRDVMPKKERQILDRIVNSGAMTRQLRDIYKDSADHVRMMDSATHGLEAKVALAYFAYKNGLLKTGPEGMSTLIDVDDKLRALMGIAGDGILATRIFEDVSTGYMERTINAGKGYDIRAHEARGLGKLNQLYNHYRNAKEKIGEPLSKFWDSKYARARDSGIPAWRQIAALLHRPQGTTGDGQGFNTAAVHKTATYLRDAANIFNGLDTKETHRVLTYLQRGPNSTTAQKASPKVAAAIKAVRTLMKDMKAYAEESGVEMGDIKDFFPVAIDLRNDTARNRLTALYSKPEYHDRIREIFGRIDGADKHPNAPKAAKPKSERPIEELVKDLVDGAMAGPEGMMANTGEGTPNFRGANYRLSQFIYEGKNDADIKEFARLQSKNPAEILGRYIEPLVKRAEYAKRFNDDGSKAQQLLDNMTKQGATDAQVEEATNMIKAALGTYGADGSPTLKMISPALAEKFSGPRTKAFMQGMQAYQNARLLPLATLSSLVDPIGIAVRTGGDFKTAWDGFKLGFKSLYDKNTKAEIHDLLSMLGSTEDMGTLESLNQGFGGAGSAFSRRINEAVFKYNGLQAWTRATRYMALESANGFMVKHANGMTDNSARYLDELGLKKGDVQTTPGTHGRDRVKLLTDAERKTASKDEVARDDRVRSAMLQFVDEAILRPHSQQTPLWYSDPYTGLVTQYKAFAYAMFDQIGGRIARETQHGNWGVILPALAYLPVTIAAELLRELLQYGTEGNPRRKDWGAFEYTQMAAMKNIAISGPRYEVQSNVFEDIQRRRVPGSSQIGPAAGQVRDVIGGNPGKSFEAALPASALWRKWNDARGGDGREAD